MEREELRIKIKVMISEVEKLITNYDLDELTLTEKWEIEKMELLVKGMYEFCQ